MKNIANSKNIVIIGPSASGKTDLAIHIAKKLKKECISADSRQIYKNLDYTTGKIKVTDNYKYEKSKNMWKINKINYWGYDVLNAGTKEAEFNFKLFTKKLFKENSDFYKNPPIIVGGTGFFISQIVNKNFITKVKPNYKLRETLADLDTNSILKILKSFNYNIDTLNNSEKNNKQRLIRRVEIAQEKKRNSSKSTIYKKDRIMKIYNNSCFIGLKRKKYKEKINNWVKLNFNKIEEEVNWLIYNYPNSHLLSGFIFSEMQDFINKNKSKSKTIELITNKYLQYIKRQNTYFKKHFSKTKWFYNKEEAENYILNSLLHS